MRLPFSFGPYHGHVHRLHRRTAYSSLHNADGGLRQLDPTDVNGIIKALINARAFASETIDILEEARHA